MLRISAAVVLLLAVVAGTVVGYAWHWLHQPLPNDTAVIVQLERGQSFHGFARSLADSELIRHPELLRLYARYSGVATAAQAGEYELQPGRSPRQLLELVVSGRVKLYDITLLEGWTVSRVLTELAARDELEHTVTHLSAENLMPALGLPESHAEGWFFPDTYRFARGATDASILQQAYRRMQQELSAVWEQRWPDVPLADPYDALILASVIEKETGREDERARVSQVFNTRLGIGMRLQTDPTVIYGFGDTFEGRLRRHHLQTDHPYNTYRHSGLPPTPIALPGRASLLAAVRPADTEYLYFVARGDGTSEFTTDYADHQAAVRRFQLGLSD